MEVSEDFRDEFCRDSPEPGTVTARGADKTPAVGEVTKQ